MDWLGVGSKNGLLFAAVGGRKDLPEREEVEDGLGVGVPGGKDLICENLENLGGGILGLKSGGRGREFWGGMVLVDISEEGGDGLEIRVGWGTLGLRSGRRFGDIGRGMVFVDISEEDGFSV